MERKKKFFTAISLTSEVGRRAVPYFYDESCEIDSKFQLVVHNPIMPFIMDKVNPGEDISLYLVVCKGDCLGDGKDDKTKWYADEREKPEFDKRIGNWIKERVEEITGDRETTFPYSVSAEPAKSDLAEVKRVFRVKNGDGADFKCTVEMITDDKPTAVDDVNNAEDEYWLNTSKAYVQLLLKLIDLVEDNDILYVDTTYGYKPLVNIWRSFCTYAVRVRKGVQIGAFSYGSLHGISNDIPKIFNHRAFLVMDEILSNSYDNESGGAIIRGLLTDLLNDDWDYDENEDDDFDVDDFGDEEE